MGYKAIDVLCTACGSVFDYLQGADEPEMWECPECGSGACERKISAPKILTSDSASFLDGTKRPGFAEAKIASDLKMEMLDKPYQEREKLKKEIKKTGVKNDL